MYLQITTRCNMGCWHCGFACTAEGEDMSMEIFKKSFELSDGIISIGGGEPTIHPDLGNMLFYAFGHAEYIWMATNGKETEIARALFYMQNDKFSCDLSVDGYHDPIDYDLEQLYRKDRRIRDVGDNLINAGRCDFGSNDRCICAGIIIKPNGNIEACGCEDAPVFGTVFKPEIPDEWEQSECHQSQVIEVGEENVIHV